jgi:hypothetical protein
MVDGFLMVDEAAGRMRAALAAGDLNEADDWASHLEDTARFSDDPSVREAAAREGVDVDGIAAAQVLRALDGTTPAAVYFDVEAAILRVRAHERTERAAFWMDVLKQLEAGVLRAFVPTPRIVPWVVRQAAREVLECYYASLRDEDR